MVFHQAPGLPSQVMEHGAAMTAERFLPVFSGVWNRWNRKLLRLRKKAKQLSSATFWTYSAESAVSGCEKFSGHVRFAEVVRATGMVVQVPEQRPNCSTSSRAALATQPEVTLSSIVE